MEHAVVDNASEFSHLQHAPACLAVYAESGELLFANKRCLDLFDTDFAAFRDSGLRSFADRDGHPFDAASHPVKKAFAGQPVDKEPLIHASPSGLKKHLLASCVSSAAPGSAGAAPSLVYAHYESNLQVCGQSRANGADKIVEKMRKITSLSPSVIFQIEVDPLGANRFSFASDSCRDAFGIDPEQLAISAEALFERVSPLHAQALRDELAKPSKSGAELSMEVLMQDAHGRSRWHLWRARHDDDASSAHCWVGYIADIDARKSVQERDEALNADFIAFLEHTPDFVYYKDRDNTVRFCSQALARAAGAEHWRNLIGQRGFGSLDLVLDCELADNQRLDEPTESSYRAHDGSMRWLESRRWELRDKSGRASGTMAIARDSTARKQAQDREAEALALVAKIADRVPGMVFQFLLRHDGSSSFPFASASIRELFGVDPEEARRNSTALFDAIHPDDVSSLRESIARSAAEMSAWNHEFRVDRPGQPDLWIESNAVPEHSPEGILWHGFLSDITERKISEAVFKGVFDQAAFLAGILDEKLNLINVNSLALKVASVAKEDVIGKYFPDTPWWDNPTERERLIEILNAALEGKASGFETSHQGPDGERVEVMFSATPIYIGGTIRIEVVGAVITKRKQAERALLNSERRFRDIIEKNRSVMLVIEPNTGNILDANPSAAYFYGYSVEELKTMNIDKINALTPAEVAEERRKATAEERHYFEFRHRIKNGEDRHVEVYTTPIADERGMLLFSIVNDISKRKALEREVHRLAYYDALTQIPNRRHLQDQLSRALAKAREERARGALVYLDLDHFKPLNDSHGHDAGDKLLRQAAERLVACAGNPELTARIGGDEFVLILNDLPADENAAREAALAFADKARKALSEPYVIEIASESASLSGLNELFTQTVTHRCTASIGVALFDASTNHIDEIMRGADSAMYAAKANGRDMVRIQAM